MPPGSDPASQAKLPGYTGHQHASQVQAVVPSFFLLYLEAPYIAFLLELKLPGYTGHQHASQVQWPFISPLCCA